MNIIKAEPTVWRLQTKTAAKNGKKIAGYCRENKILAMGWSLHEETINEECTKEKVEILKLKRNNIKTEEDFEEVFKEVFWNDYKKHKNNINPNIRRLQYEVKTSDLVWMRDDGLYYLGRIGENSKWRYLCNEEALNNDASNQRTDVEWIKVGGEDSIAGRICTAFIQGSTLQRIKQPGIKEFSQYIYNMLGDDNKKYDFQNMFIKNKQATFYSFISSADCEDLLCMWLYKKFGYICIPSTNKKATELYECVLLDPESDKRIYIQEKIGKDNPIFATKSKQLRGDVYLFNSDNEVKEINEVENNIRQIYSEELFEFAFDKNNKNILPKSILTWIDLINNLSN